MRWTSEEDKILLSMCNAQQQANQDHSIKDWNTVASALPNRSNKDCRKRWLNALAIGNCKGRWMQAEDDALREAVAQLGTSWALVSQTMATRSADQCAKRWQQNLDPSLENRDWTPEESRQLLEAVKHKGRKWIEIRQSLFPRRATNNIKNHYNVLKRSSTASCSNQLAQDSASDDEGDEEEDNNDYGHQEMHSFNGSELDTRRSVGKPSDGISHSSSSSAIAIVSEVLVDSSNNQGDFLQLRSMSPVACADGSMYHQAETRATAQATHGSRPTSPTLDVTEAPDQANMTLNQGFDLDFDMFVNDDGFTNTTMISTEWVGSPSINGQSSLVNGPIVSSSWSIPNGNTGQCQSLVCHRAAGSIGEAFGEESSRMDATSSRCDQVSSPVRGPYVAKVTLREPSSGLVGDIMKLVMEQRGSASVEFEEMRE